MPMITPNSNEDKELFIKRFMSDANMIAEFPDEKQRMAIAIGQWEGVDRYKAAGVTEGRWMLSNDRLQPSNGEQVIKVFPRGEFWINKYKQTVNFDDNFFSQITSAFSSEGLSKPFIDKDHEFKTSFGDILGNEIRDDGMYFKVKLNTKGMELVKNREYSYVSPAWGKTIDTGKREFPNRLLAISLVNFPALEGTLSPLQNQMTLSKFDFVAEKEKEGKMELYMLANELDLNKDASLESVLSAVKELKTKISGYETGTKELSTKLKSAEDLAIKLSQEIKEQKDAELKKEATEFVKEQIVLGKLAPAVQDIVIERYVLNKDATVKEYSLIPEKVYTGKQSVQSDAAGLDPEIKAKMLKADLDPNDKESVTIALEKWGGK